MNATLPKPFIRAVKHTSKIELSRSALRQNVNFIRRQLTPSTRYSAVVKANAYGHGIPHMVKMLEECEVDHFSVASAFEAEEVYHYASENSDIMIMGILYDEDIEPIIIHGIEFYIFSYDRLRLVAEKARKAGKKAKVHLEVETGINRTGMSMEYFKNAVTFLKKHQDVIQLQGLCTHLGGAESISNAFRIEQQIKRFAQYRKLLEQAGLKACYYHIACSAAVFNMPETHLDLVRVGVATYGFWPSKEVYYQYLQRNGKKKDSPLRRMISWKSDVMDTKAVAKGEFIGYGTAYQALEDMRIAVIPVGYGNGYPRGQSNSGYVLIRGRKAPITGLINMNMFMVDVSHIPDVMIGDEVVLIGKQKNNTINVSSFTNYTQLLNNEMLSRLPTAIPRLITK